MKVLVYNELNTKVIKGFSKLCKQLEKEDFASADVRKIGDNLYRAKLNRSDRILFTVGKNQEDRFILLLEYLPNHSYEKSRFIRFGVELDEEKTPNISPEKMEMPSLPYVNRNHSRFNMLNKIISFDDAQDTIYRLPVPLMIIGSAGSGKTALTLEKMKQQRGDILYLTLSPYLAQHSRELYYANHYENEHQNLEFLSFYEFLETIEVPKQREASIQDFLRWFSTNSLPKSLRKPHQIFEEIKGVITGTAKKAWLSRKDYLSLGVKQSIFTDQERENIYDCFERYLRFLEEDNLFDSNIISYQWLSKVQKRYDCIIVDEVQDLTMTQLQFVLHSLKNPSSFLLCGDSNQIVHPNFFSWSTLKSYFYQQKDSEKREILKILHTNYRNTAEVTYVANQILRLKQARFGSIDKESNYLVQSNNSNQGGVQLVESNSKMLKELNEKIRQSAKFAIIVMKESDKDLVRNHFNTPLVFSIQEAKGLEYPNIILYNFISSEEKRFREIAGGISPNALSGELIYKRVKDKKDKSLEVYKFYINALYVAITRAISNIYWVEEKPKQPIFQLLQMEFQRKGLDIQTEKSTKEEWQKEAAKLRKQGKTEQADSIDKQILNIRPTPWKAMTVENAADLMKEVEKKKHRKKMMSLLEYSLLNQNQFYINRLLQFGYQHAQKPSVALEKLVGKKYRNFKYGVLKNVLNDIEKYGIDYRDEYNLTPLMIASMLGKENVVEELLHRGANRDLQNSAGLNALQLMLHSLLIKPKPKDIRKNWKKAARLYELLCPPFIDIQIDGALIRIGNHLMEFQVFNLLMIIFYTHWFENFNNNYFQGNTGFQREQLSNIFNDFPLQIIPEYRKKKNYLSSILSNNEFHKEYRYNRRFLFRVRRGHYVLNPRMDIRIGGEWIRIYDVLQHKHIAIQNYQNYRWKNGQYEELHSNVHYCVSSIAKIPKK